VKSRPDPAATIRRGGPTNRRCHMIEPPSDRWLARRRHNVKKPPPVATPHGVCGPANYCRSSARVLAGSPPFVRSVAAPTSCPVRQLRDALSVCTEVKAR